MEELASTMKTFSKKINMKYLVKLFQEVLPNESFDFKILSRDSLDTKIKNEILRLEVDIDSFSTDILNYKEISSPPESFINIALYLIYHLLIKIFHIQLKITVKLKTPRFYCYNYR